MTGNSSIPDKAKALAIAKYLVENNLEFKTFQDMKIKRCHFEAVSFAVYGNIQSFSKFYCYFRGHPHVVKTKFNTLKREKNKRMKGCSVVTSAVACMESDPQDQEAPQQAQGADFQVEIAVAPQDEDVTVSQNKSSGLSQTTDKGTSSAMDVEPSIAQSVEAPSDAPHCSFTPDTQVSNNTQINAEKSAQQAAKRHQNLLDSSVPIKKVKPSEETVDEGNNILTDKSPSSGESTNIIGMSSAEISKLKNISVYRRGVQVSVTNTDIVQISKIIPQRKDKELSVGVGNDENSSRRPLKITQNINSSVGKTSNQVVNARQSDSATKLNTAHNNNTSRQSKNTPHNIEMEKIISNDKNTTQASLESSEKGKKLKEKFDKMKYQIMYFKKKVGNLHGEITTLQKYNDKLKVTESENVNLKNDVAILRKKHRDMEKTEQSLLELQNTHENDKQYIKKLKKNIQILQSENSELHECNKKLQSNESERLELKLENLVLRRTKEIKVKEIDKMKLELQKSKEENEELFKKEVEKCKEINETLLKTENQCLRLIKEIKEEKTKREILEKTHDITVSHNCKLKSSINILNIQKSNFHVRIEKAAKESSNLKHELNSTLKDKNVLKTVNINLEKDNCSMSNELKIKRECISCIQEDLKNKLELIDNLNLKIKNLQNNCKKMEIKIKSSESMKKIQILENVIKVKDKTIMNHELVMKGVMKHIESSLLNTTH